MKIHPLLKVSGILYIILGLASILTLVGFTIFGVLLAETEDPNINLIILLGFILTALVSIILELVAGNNAIRGGSLMQCQSLALTAIVCNAVAWLTGNMSGQIWYPYPAGIILSIVFLAGIRKEIARD